MVKGATEDVYASQVCGGSEHEVRMAPSMNDIIYI